MSGLQPLYEVKERLEYAAIAGVSLLGEDFRLQRAAEALKPLAAASPVFAKIDGGLQTLLSAPAEQRAGLLLDVLSLVDAVAYTQAKTGGEGELEPLPTGSGAYQQISYGQIGPILTALTSTGSGRMEVVRSAWENHPEFFSDFRVLPAVVAGLGDSYGEIAEQNAGILKGIGPAVLPLLRQSFDPAGKKEMVRRVEVISMIEGADATPWLREILPAAKKDVRAAVIAALGEHEENTALLLDLSKTERGKNRETVLQALALLEGEAVQDFWVEELAKNSAAICHLDPASSVWASDLVAAGLRERLEQVLAGPERVPKETQEELRLWLGAANHKSSPAMVECWRWVASRMEAIDRLKNHIGQPLYFGNQLSDWLLYCLCDTGAKPLCDLCRELWEQNKEISRWLSHAVIAALLTRPAAEVYDTFSPYICTTKPLRNGAQKQLFHNAVLKGLGRVARDLNTGVYFIGSAHTLAQPLDKRWFKQLTHAVWKTTGGKSGRSHYAYWEFVDEFDLILTSLADPTDEETRKLLIPYLRERLAETGQTYTYSRYLFRFGGSPRGLLGKAMAKDPKTNRLYVVWALMNEANLVLPTEETIALLEEVLTSGGINKDALPTAQQAIPWTIEQLKAGKPFPSNDEWAKMRP